MTLERLDQRVVPALATLAGRLAGIWVRVNASAPVRLVAVAIADTGLLGPAVLLVLLTGVLFAATGGDIGH